MDALFKTLFTVYLLYTGAMLVGFLLWHIPSRFKALLRSFIPHR